MVTKYLKRIMLYRDHISLKYNIIDILELSYNEIMNKSKPHKHDMNAYISYFFYLSFDNVYLEIVTELNGQI